MECIKKRLLQISFILYIIFILYITLFSRNIGNGFAWENGKLEYYLSNSVNLIPFKSINHIFRYFNFSNMLFNILGNFILFMPFAFFLKNLWNKKISLFSFLITMFIISLIIEVIQFITLSGSFDIDDIILNVGGAVCSFELFNKSIPKIMKIIFVVLFFLLTSILVFTKKYDSTENNLYILKENFNCNEEETLFYEDEYYNYYMKCPNDVVISYNQKNYSLIDFLNHIARIESVETLIKDYHKYPKYQSITIPIKGRYIVMGEVKEPHVLLLDIIPEYNLNHELIFYNIFMKALSLGETTFELKITNSDNGNIEEVKKYKAVVTKNFEVSVTEL